MLKPGGFLKKVFNPGNVAGKVGKAMAAPAKAMGGVFGGGKKAANVEKKGGSIFGGKKGDKMGGLIAKAKEMKAAKTKPRNPGTAIMG